jgi:hypothetical protein
MVPEITVDTPEVAMMGQVKAAGKRDTEFFNFQIEGAEIFLIAWPYSCSIFQRLIFSNKLCF